MESIRRTVRDFFAEFVDIRTQYGIALNSTGAGDEEIFVGYTHINLYVTGLSQALAAVIAMCAINGVPLTLYHFNKDTGDYYPQTIFRPLN